MEGKMDTYTNRDFYLSSYLLAAGMRLKSFHKTNGITTFEFDNSEKLQDLIKDYYSTLLSERNLTEIRLHNYFFIFLILAYFGFEIIYSDKN
jgi:hypothetical protein